MAIKATLRTPSKDAAAAAAAVGAVQVLKQEQTVPGTDVKVETITGAAGPGAPLTPDPAAQTGAFEESLYGDNPAVATAANTTTAVATTTGTTGSVARPMVTGNEGEFEGEFDQSDLKFPTLTIVQGTGGPLIEAGFAQGDLVFNNELLFPGPRPKEPSKVLRVVPIHIAKSYRECLSQQQVEEGVMPRLFKSKAELAAAGLSLQWFNNPDPCARPSARVIFLVEAPAETEHPGFGLELDGKANAVGVYYAKTGAYKETAQAMFNVWQTILWVDVLDEQGKPITDEIRGLKRARRTRCLYKCYWNFSWALVKAGQFNVWRPQMRVTRDETGPQVRDFCAEILRGRAEVQAD